MHSLRRTPVFKLDCRAPAPDITGLCADIIRRGGLVAFPTETVYGIAARADNREALKRLHYVKKRPVYKPYTVHVSDISAVKKMGCAVSADAARLAARFWAGPLTLILRSKNGRKIGFRVPDNKIAVNLIKAVGVPIVAPSANPSGRKPPGTAAEVVRYFDGKLDAVIDGGPTKLRVASTVVDASVKPFKVLREGAISIEELNKSLL